MRISIAVQRRMRCGQDLPGRRLGQSGPNGAQRFERWAGSESSEFEKRLQGRGPALPGRDIRRILPLYPTFLDSGYFAQHLSVIDVWFVSRLRKERLQLIHLFSGQPEIPAHQAPLVWELEPGGQRSV